MSDLKHQSLEELYRRRDSSEKYIGTLRGKINNAQIRLEWINKYIEQKTPKLPTFEELQIGDFFRTDNGTSIRMKIKDGERNALIICTGYTYNHPDDCRVVPVSGTFVTGGSL